MSTLRILALEAYYGGSHRAFLDTWRSASRHQWTFLTLPARHWKWRMRASAAWFAEQFVGGQDRPVTGARGRTQEADAGAMTGSNPVGEPGPPDDPAGGFDAIFTSDMTSVADLRALLPVRLRGLPVICYFHENQLTYPLSPHDWRDYQYALTNITSALAADGLWFNSHSHLDAFTAAIDKLFGQMPDFVPTRTVETIRHRAKVVYPAVALPPAQVMAAPAGRPARLRILWNHRWEYDKNPEAYLKALMKLESGGADFELVFLGESFRVIPEAFRSMWEHFQPRIVHAGFVPDMDDYWRLVRSCHVVVSTAIQENFGLAVVEAILAGCSPVLPNRLSYPEIIPPRLHGDHLYDKEAHLSRMLAKWARQPTPGDTPLAVELMERFGVHRHIPRLDDVFADAVRSRAV